MMMSMIMWVMMLMILDERDIGGEDGGGDDVDDDDDDDVDLGVGVGAYMWWYGVLCILTHAICFIFVQLRTFQFVFIMLPILHGHAPPKPSVVVLI